MKVFIFGILQLLLLTSLQGQGENLFNDEILHEIRLTEVDTNVFIQTKNYQSVNITIDGTNLENIGFKKKGNISASHPNHKFPFKIKTNKYVDGQLYDEIREFTLHNNFEDPSMLREKMTYDLLADLGLNSLQTAFAKVYINDNYWGLYTLVEAKDELYRRAFGDDDGTVLESLDFGTMCYQGPDRSDYYNDILQEYDYKLDNGDIDTAWTYFPAMLDAANNTPAAIYVDVVSRLFDITDFITYQAANVYLLNFDSYIAFRGNQLYYYQESTGVWQVVPWDFNASFGLWNTNQFSPTDYATLPSVIQNGCIASKIIEVPELRPIYENTLCALVNNYASVERLEGQVDQWAELIEEAVLTDNRKAFANTLFPTALGNTYFEYAFEPNVPGMKAFINDRASFVEEALVAANIVCNTTNVEDGEVSTPITIFPNPTAATIKIQGLIEQKTIIIRAFNGNGETVNIPTLNAHELDVTSLASGVYYLQLQSVEGAVQYLRFLKI